jgi:hypothetical protein
MPPQHFECKIANCASSKAVDITGESYKTTILCISESNHSRAFKRLQPVHALNGVLSVGHYAAADRFTHVVLGTVVLCAR